jgi:hypothetical protein
MNPVYRYLGSTATVILTALMLQSCSKVELCQVKTDQAQTKSVQANHSIYNQVFGSQRCSPKKLLLRVPVNLISSTNPQQRSSSQKFPEITTMVTFSREYKTFYIRRIDRHLNDVFYYSPKDSCLSWKWSENNQKLILSLERNLQINDPSLKSIIFIISLPVELKEAAGNIDLHLYTWDRGGEKYDFNLKTDYPILKDALREKERNKLQSRDFNENQKASQEISEEFNLLSDRPGLYLDRDIKELIEATALEKYQLDLHFPSCKVPPDLQNTHNSL